MKEYIGWAILTVILSPWIVGVIDIYWYIFNGVKLSGINWGGNQGIAAIMFPFLLACALALIWESQ